MCVHDRGCECTCAFKVSTEFEAFADAALGVRRKSFLYVLHTYTTRAIFTLPKESIDEHLQREKILKYSPKSTRGISNKIRISNFYRCPTRLNAGPDIML